MINKHFLTLIVLLTLISCDFGWSEKNKLKINGKVKKVTKIKYRIKKDSIGIFFNDTTTVDIINLNRKGHLIDREFKFYLNNRIIQTGITEFFYNSNNLLTKEIYRNKKDSIDIEVYYSYKDSLLSHSNSNYSSDDLILNYNEKYSYQKNGRLKHSEYRQLIVDSKTKDTSSFQQNSSYYDNDGFLIKIKWESSENDLLNSIDTYENDENGLVLKEKKYNLKEQLLDSSIFKYKFDNKRNWIKAEEFKNNEIITITERIIE